MKKLLSVIMAFVMVFAMAAPAFAGGDEEIVSSGISFDIGSIFNSVFDGVADFFNGIINFFKDLFGLNEQVGYYTIKFVDADGTVYGTYQYAAGSEIGAPGIPEKDGYVFMNWYPAIPEKMPERDVVIEAQWAEVY